MPYTKSVQQTVSVTTPLQQLLQSNIIEELSNNRVRVIFRDTGSAKAFQSELFKIGIENRGMKGAARKIKVLAGGGMEDSQERYAIELTKAELEAVKPALPQSQHMTQLNEHYPYTNQATIVNYINFKQKLAIEIGNARDKFTALSIPADTKKHIDEVERRLNDMISGGDLWSAVNNAIEQMPGWWAFVTGIGPFKSALKSLLIQYPQNKLLQKDLELLRQHNSLLTENYTKLEQKYYKLKKDIENLEHSDIMDTCKILVVENQELKENVVALEKENKNLKLIIKNLEKDVKEVRDTNAELEICNEKLTNTCESLQKKQDNHERKYNKFKSRVRTQFEEFKQAQETQEIQNELFLSKLTEKDTTIINQQIKILQLETKILRDDSDTCDYKYRAASPLLSSKPKPEKSVTKLSASYSNSSSGLGCEIHVPTFGNW